MTFRRLSVLICAVLLLCMTVLPVFAVSYPNPDSFFADETSKLSDSTKRSLIQTNTALQKDTGCTIGVCAVPAAYISSTSIGNYARAIFRNWQMGEGVLILISVDAANEDNNDYYVLQSKGVESVATNDVLSDINLNYMEEDFAAGNIDRAVQNVITKLSMTLTAGMPSLSSASTKEASGETGSSFGKAVVGFFKFILYVILILGVAFVALFVAAMFNDDANNFMQTYIFRRKPKKQGTGVDMNGYYDERLYGNGNAARGQQNSRNAQGAGSTANRRNPQNRGQQPYQNGQRVNQNSRQPGTRQYNGNNGGQQNRSVNANGQNGANRRPVSGDTQNYNIVGNTRPANDNASTRQFTINGNRNNY